MAGFVFKNITQEGGNNYTFKLPEIDKTRDTAVYIRQSHRKADIRNGESRKMQLALKVFAMKLRGQEDMQNIRVYDEGAGKSGTLRVDERPKLNELWRDLRSGEIGHVIVAREDRLFRDKFGDQSGAFARLASDLDIMLLVPPFQASGELDDYGAVTFYDFNNDAHLQNWHKKMVIAADYITGHCRYMAANRLSKSRRGAYDGRTFPPGLILERNAPKDIRKPVLYKPWADRMKWVFERAEALNWNVHALMREIEHMPYLFPDLPPEDAAKYELACNLTKVPGGYKPKWNGTYAEWFENVHLIGWWTIGNRRRPTGTIEVIVGNHPAVIDESLFRRAYEYHTGYTLEGEEVPRTQEKRVKQVRKKQPSPEALFHGRLKCPSTQGVYVQAYKGDARYVAYDKNSVNVAEAMFSIKCEWIDACVIDRLRDLLAADVEIADRVKEHLIQVLAAQGNEHGSIEDQLAEIARKLHVARRRREKLNEELSGKEEDEEEYDSLTRRINALTKQQEQLLAKQQRTTQVDGPEEVEKFYDTLSNFDAKWGKLTLEEKQRLIDLLVKSVSFDMRTPHWLMLEVHWLGAVNPRSDTAYVWKSSGSHVDSRLTDVEMEVIRQIFPTFILRSDMLRMLPTRSYSSLRTWASQNGIKKAPGIRGLNDFPTNACWADLDICENKEKARRLMEAGIKGCEENKRGAYAIWPLDIRPKALIEGLRDYASLRVDSEGEVSVIP